MLQELHENITTRIVILHVAIKSILSYVQALFVRIYFKGNQIQDTQSSLNIVMRVQHSHWVDELQVIFLKSLMPSLELFCVLESNLLSLNVCRY